MNADKWGELLNRNRSESRPFDALPMNYTYCSMRHMLLCGFLLTLYAACRHRVRRFHSSEAGWRLNGGPARSRSP